MTVSQALQQRRLCVPAGSPDAAPGETALLWKIMLPVLRSSFPGCCPEGSGQRAMVGAALEIGVGSERINARKWPESGIINLD
jgi:hypothetical protein